MQVLGHGFSKFVEGRHGNKIGGWLFVGFFGDVLAYGYENCGNHRKAVILFVDVEIDITGKIADKTNLVHDYLLLSRWSGLG
jgi:hypothetical protein